jgi:two-component system, LytTR family, response regulator
MKPIRTLLADDEPLARDRLRSLLEADPDLALVAECRNGQEVRDQLLAGDVDLAFLDVQMPEIDGLQALEGLPAQRMPAVVFVTAHDRYALRAFEVHALDYVLKPFDPDRFQDALTRAKDRVRRDRRELDGEQLLRTLEELGSKKRRPERLIVKDSGKMTVVRIDDIDRVEAAGNYVCVHTGQITHTLRDTMADMEQQLDPDKFVRIHRSHIVNVDRIRELHPLFGGEYTVILRDGTKLTLSRSYRDRLKDVLGRPL